MPCHWKCINFIFVLLPKILLCHYVLLEGTLLLMDTAGIMDMVLGAMSMGFVLSIDEIIFSTITSIPTKHIMKELGEWSSNVDTDRGTQDERDPRGIESLHYDTDVGRSS